MVDPATIKKLTDNPGILPAKLGSAQNAINEWTFVQIFNLTGIINEFNILKAQYERLKSTIESSEHYKREYHNSYNLIATIQIKISNQLAQINPLNRRYKRGLINGLGSIIKVITGNLDHEDARHYDEAIGSLTNNQMKMKAIVNTQTSLLENSIKKFVNVTKTLEHNQVVLESRLLQVEQTIKTVGLTELDSQNYFLIHTLLTQIHFAYQLIFDVLERIETAISFAKLNVLHNSIIEPSDLLEELKNITSQISEVKLPFQPILENVLLFEKILNIRCFSKGNQIIFIIEIPLVEINQYNYYHLYALPVPDRENFRLIIPKSPYLILNEQNYVFMDSNCQEVERQNYICKVTKTMRIEPTQPCEIQLLKFSEISETQCHVINARISKLQIQKLEDNNYVIIAPEETVARQRCNGEVENILLKGTYVVQIDSNCEIIIGHLKINNYKNTKSKIKVIELPNLEMNFKSGNTKTSVIKLDSIDFGNLNNIQSALSDQHVKLNEISSDKIYTDKIGIWTLIIYIVIFIIICICFSKYVIEKVSTLSKAKKTKNQSKDPGTEIVI